MAVVPLAPLTEIAKEMGPLLAKFAAGGARSALDQGQDYVKSGTMEVHAEIAADYTRVGLDYIRETYEKALSYF